MSPEKMTARQCFYLLFLFLLGNLVTATGAKGKQSGWLLFVLLALVSLPLLLLFVKAVGQRCAGEIFTDTLGKRAGSVVTILYCVLAIMLGGDAIRLFADFIVINDLNDAGAAGNSILLAVSVLMLLYSTARSYGKAAWVIQPVAVMLLILSVILTLNNLSFQRLLPLLPESPGVLLKSGIGSFSGIFAPAFFPIAVFSQAAPTGEKRAILAAGVTAAVLLSVLTLRDAAVLGYPAVELFRFPGFTAASTQRHSEILISAVFVLAQPFRTALCLRYVQECLCFWLPRWNKWYPPLLLGLAAASGILSWSSEQVRWRTAGETVIGLFLVAGPLAVVVIDHIRRRKARA